MTFGVEEEFLVVDRKSRRTVRQADVVLKHAAAGVLPVGAVLHEELLSSQAGDPIAAVDRLIALKAMEET